MLSRKKDLSTKKNANKTSIVSFVDGHWITTYLVEISQKHMMANPKICTHLQKRCGQNVIVDVYHAQTTQCKVHMP